MAKCSVEIKVFVFLSATAHTPTVVANEIETQEKTIKKNYYLCEMEIDKKNLSLIKKICERYSVKTLSVFGSVVRGNFNSESDIDFVVDFNENDPFKYSDLYFELKDKLEKLLNRKIDLIELRGIKNSFFKKELDETKVLIYG